MAQQLQISNFGSINVKDKMVLDADSAAALTTLVVRNSAGFTIGDYIVVGGLGSEGSELVQIQTIPDATHVTLYLATKLVHTRFDPITLLFGNKIRIYRAPNVSNNYPADSAYVYLDVVDIDADEAMTGYIDATGSNAYWYKFTYHNSTAATETALADSVAERGGGYDTYCSIDDIREEAGLQNNQYITDGKIDKKRYEAQYEIDSALQGLYTVPFQPPINPVISAIAIKLAAGKVLSMDYGVMSSGNSKDGKQKQIDARAELKQIDDKLMTLTDINGNDISITNAGGTKAWPNNTTSTTPVDQGGSDRNFRYGMRF